MIPVLLLMFAIAAPAISGVVRDPSGAVVAGASVVVKPASGAEHLALTGPDGRFAVDMPVEGDVSVIVRAGGFAEPTDSARSNKAHRMTRLMAKPLVKLFAGQPMPQLEIPA